MNFKNTLSFVLFRDLTNIFRRNENQKMLTSDSISQVIIILRFMRNSELYLQSKLIRSAPALLRSHPAPSTTESLILFFVPTKNNANDFEREG